jgi:hypothetical protein
MPQTNYDSDEDLKKREAQARSSRMDDDGAEPTSSDEQSSLDQIEAGSKDKSSSKKSKDESLEGRLGRALNDSIEADDVENTGFYRGGDKGGTGILIRGRNLVSTVTQNRKLLGGILGGGGAVLSLILVFNFLNIFKLEHLLNNIDAQTFSRINATFDRRSDAWVKSYVMLRLMEYEGSVNPDQDNLFFKANRVDTNHPLRDWYRTARTGSFEEDVFRKNGITFTSMIDRNGNPKPAFITFKGASTGDIEFDFDPTVEFGDYNRALDLFTQMEAGDVSAFNQLGDKLDTFISVNELDSDSAARRAIKQHVNDNVHPLRVFKRRHIRKDIQNKIGVRDWRFFEQTRASQEDRKIAFQKKLLTKLLPEDTRSGKFILCVFGAGPCPSNTDPNNPANRSGSIPDGTRTDSEGEKDQYDAEGNLLRDEAGNPIKSDVGTNGSFADVVDVDSLSGTEDLVRTTFLKQIMSKLSIVTGTFSLVQTMDMLSRVDANLTSGGLSKLAVMAKGAQAMAAYTTYAIAKDQTRTGELTMDEYGLLMGTLNGAESSEAYDYFFNDSSSGTVSAATSKEQYCDDTYTPEPGEYVWTCDKYKVGGTSNANRIQDMYANSIGAVATPLMEAYREIRNAPGISQVLDIVNAISGKISDLISVIIDPVLDSLGISDSIERFTTWLTEKVMVFLGAGPILAGTQSEPGLILTMFTQGSEVTAEATTRGSGAPVTNPATAEYVKDIELAYLQQERASMSFTERYFDVSNTDSLAAQTLGKVSTFSPSKVSSYLGSFGNFLTNILPFLGPQADAQASDRETLSEITTYDFPPQCLELEPLDLTPPSGLTNADDLTNAEGQPFIDSSLLTLELLGNSDQFWQKVYERVGDNDTDPVTVEQIYNCETLEQRVRGSLGYTSGYTKDGGLEDGVVVTSSQSQNNNTPINCASATGNALIVCAAQQYVGIRYSNGSTRWNSEWGVSNTNNRLNGGANAEIFLSRNGNSITTLVNEAFIDCSGYTNLSLFVAFGYKTTAGCSGYYTRDNNNDGLSDSDRNLRIVSMDSLQPGDFLTVSNVCNQAGQAGHIGIYVSTLPNGNLRTLESSAGRNSTDQTKTSGFYERSPDYFKYASRYVGPGTTP